LSDTERKNFQDFVADGKGVIVLHHAIADYNNWPWFYEQIAGGKYFLKAEKGHPASTYKHDVELFVEAVAKHPVLGDIGPMHIIDEGYKFRWISPKATILLKTKHEESDDALAWVMPHDKARLVTIVLGHDKQAHVHDGFRKLVKNAIDWSARKK
jgi:type 1 glutamine amidotransferase